MCRIPLRDPTHCFSSLQSPALQFMSPTMTQIQEYTGAYPSRFNVYCGMKNVHYVACGKQSPWPRIERPRYVRTIYSPMRVVVNVGLYTSLPDHICPLGRSLSVFTRYTFWRQLVWSMLNSTAGQYQPIKGASVQY
jgi:hypothetical protein